jgi:hypothetical protein
MAIVGLLMIFVGIMFAFVGIANEEKPNIILGVSLFLFGVLFMVVDHNAEQIVAEERLIQTNDYAQYGLPVDSTRVGIILEKRYKNSLPVGVYVKAPTYQFLDWVAE